MSITIKLAVALSLSLASPIHCAETPDASFERNYWPAFQAKYPHASRAKGLKRVAWSLYVGQRTSDILSTMPDLGPAY